MPLRTRPSLRFAACFALSIALGLITSVLVAWLCAGRVAWQGAVAYSVSFQDPDLEALGWKCSAQGLHRHGVTVTFMATLTESPANPPPANPPNVARVAGPGKSASTPDTAWQHSSLIPLIHAALNNQAPRATRLAQNKQRAAYINAARDSGQIPQNATPSLITIPDDQPVIQMFPTRLIAAGWPMRCLWAEHRSSSNQGMNHWFATGGWIIPPTVTTATPGPLTRNPFPWILPYRPVWPALALNTLVFSLPWLALLLVIPTLRQRIRRKRGHCVACGYDLRGGTLGSPCPECGSVSPALSPAPSPS